MRMSRRMAIHCQGGKIKQPLYTGSYTVTQLGTMMYMYLKTSGTLTIQSKGDYDLFVVGGGGRGGYGGYYNGDGMDEENYGAGGGSGYTSTKKAQALAKNQVLNVSIGAGATAYSGRGSTFSPATGGATSIGALLSAAGGQSGIKSTYARSMTSFMGGRPGGSGGGAVCGNSSGAHGGNGGSNGSNGGDNGASEPLEGGAGQGITTRAFGESNNTLYGGGGGGNGGEGAAGDGGAGGGGKGSASATGAVAGTANTGGGGGGNACGNSRSSGESGVGGSGIAIIRWAA